MAKDKKRSQRKKSTRRVGRVSRRRHQLLFLPTHRQHAIKLMGNVTRAAVIFFFYQFTTVQFAFTPRRTHPTIETTNWNE
jgi:hypothetical protein